MLKVEVAINKFIQDNYTGTLKTLTMSMLVNAALRLHDFNAVRGLRPVVFENLALVKA